MFNRDVVNSVLPSVVSLFHWWMLHFLLRLLFNETRASLVHGVYTLLLQKRNGGFLMQTSCFSRNAACLQFLFGGPTLVLTRWLVQPELHSDYGQNECDQTTFQRIYLVNPCKCSQRVVTQWVACSF
jgi:hypothetical protein